MSPWLHSLSYSLVQMTLKQILKNHISVGSFVLGDKEIRDCEFSIIRDYETEEYDNNKTDNWRMIITPSRVVVISFCIIKW